MALPVTISNVNTIPGYIGPFKSSGGAFYTVFRDSGGGSLVEAYKATDPTTSFSGVGTSPDTTDLILAQSVHQDGNLLHVGTQSNLDDVYYSQFNMGTDAWDVSAESVDGAPDGAEDFCFVSVRSDGDVIIVYQGETQADMGTNYERVDLARRESASWTAAIAVGVNAKDPPDETGPVVQRGDATNDRMHVFFRDHTNDDLKYSTYLNDNTFGHTNTTIDSTANLAQIYMVGKGASFDDGGTIKVRVPYFDSSGGVSIAGFNDADSPSASVIAADVTTGSANADMLFSLRVDGTTQHLIWADNTDDDLMRDETGAGNDTWGTDADVETLGSNTTFLSANIYSRTTTKLAYIYNDNGTVKYNEVDLGGATTVTKTTSLDAALQKQVTITTSLNAALQKQDIALTANLDGILVRVLTLTTDLDALLKKAVAATASLDAALKKEGVTATTSLDAALQKQDIALTAEFDAFLKKAAALTASFDAFLKKEGVTATTSLDAALKKENISVTASLDAVLSTLTTVTTSLDAALQKQGVTVLVSLDAALQKRGIALTAALDALLQQTASVATSFDALLKSTVATTTSFDAVLQSLGNAVTVTTSLDAALRKTVTATTDFDAVLTAIAAAVAPRRNRRPKMIGRMGMIS